MTTMAAGKFKATCLALLDEVESKRISVVVTKHGRPVAMMVPMDLAEREHPLDAFKYPGKVKTHGDIVSPIYSDFDLEEMFEAPSVELR